MTSLSLRARVKRKRGCRTFVVSATLLPLVLLKLLLVLHAAVAVALAGAATHNGLLGLSSLRGRPPRVRLERFYPSAVLWLFLASVLIGALLYPSFRVDVRAAYLDEAMPLGTRLFEFKEHLVAMGLFAAVVQRVLAGRDEMTAADRLLFDVARVAVMLVVFYAGLVGFFLVSVKSV